MLLCCNSSCKHDLSILKCSVAYLQSVIEWTGENQNGHCIVMYYFLQLLQHNYCDLWWRWFCNNSSNNNVNHHHQILTKLREKTRIMVVVVLLRATTTKKCQPPPPEQKQQQQTNIKTNKNRLEDVVAVVKNIVMSHYSGFHESIPLHSVSRLHYTGEKIGRVYKMNYNITAYQSSRFSNCSFRYRI